jgi:hypothetical protein
MGRTKQAGRQGFNTFAMPVSRTQEGGSKMSCLPCSPVTGLTFDAFVKADLSAATGSKFDLDLIDQVFA